MLKNTIENFESLSEQDISKYSGQWIAIIERKVVFHGLSFKELYLFIKNNYQNKKPLITKLPEANPIVLSIS